MGVTEEYDQAKSKVDAEDKDSEIKKDEDKGQRAVEVQPPSDQAATIPADASGSTGIED